MAKQIDIMDIRQAVKDGLLSAYVSRGIIYLKDMDSEEVVKIGQTEQVRWVKAKEVQNDSGPNKSNH